MNKNLFIRLAALLAIAALVVVPAASQAKTKPKPEKPAIWAGCKSEEFHKGGKCQTISWGTLTFENAELGSVTCKKSDAGNIWNPAGTTANGLDEVVLLDFYECNAPLCPTAAIKPLHLPWKTELFRLLGFIYDRVNGIELEFSCAAPAFSFIATGTLEPKMVNGSPGYEEFSAASGSLSSAFGPIIVTGKDKNLGFENGEKIKVK